MLICAVVQLLIDIRTLPRGTNGHMKQQLENHLLRSEKEVDHKQPRRSVRREQPAVQHHPANKRWATPKSSTGSLMVDGSEDYGLSLKNSLLISSKCQTIDLSFEETCEHLVNVHRGTFETTWTGHIIHIISCECFALG